MAEDVHQQGIGTGAGIEFHPAAAIGVGKGMAGLRVDFGQTAIPVGIGADRFVAGGQEVAVLGILGIGRETDDGGFSVAERVGQRFFRGVLLSADG